MGGGGKEVIGRSVRWERFLVNDRAGAHFLVHPLQFQIAWSNVTSVNTDKLALFGPALSLINQ